jgi:hypothetical protein
MPEAVRVRNLQFRHFKGGKVLDTNYDTRNAMMPACLPSSTNWLVAAGNHSRKPGSKLPALGEVVGRCARTETATSNVRVRMCLQIPRHKNHVVAIFVSRA